MFISSKELFSLNSIAILRNLYEHIVYICQYKTGVRGHTGMFYIHHDKSW